MNDEIDLRRYWRVIAKRATLIRDMVIVAVVLALVAEFALAATRSPMYVAKVQMLMLRSRSQVVFDPRIQTLTQDNPAAQGALGALNPQVRQKSLAVLVQSSQVAAAVAQEMRERFPAANLSTDSLVGMVTSVIVPGTDLIEIRVSSLVPSMSVAIANAWASEYAKFVNRVYTETSPGNSLENRIAQAKAKYARSQFELTGFVRDNKISSLQQRLRLLSIAAAYLTASPTKDTSEIPPEFTIIPPDLRAIRNLAYLYQTRVRLEAVKQNAQSLQAQLEGGGDPTAVSSVLAMLVLKAQAFAPGGTGTNLQINLSSDSINPSGIVADVRSLITAVNMRLGELNGEIRAEARGLLPQEARGTGEPEELVRQVVADLNRQINELQAQLADEEAHQNELVKIRDLDWNSYVALAQKQEEQNVSQASPGREIELVSPALSAADESVGVSNPIRNVAGAAVAAAILAMIIALLLERLNPTMAVPSLPWPGLPGKRPTRAPEPEPANPHPGAASESQR